MFHVPGYETLARIYEEPGEELYRARRLNDHLPVILKVCSRSGSAYDLLNEYRRAEDMLESLNQAGVIKCYGFLYTDERPVLVLEDFGGQSLESLLATRQFSFAWLLEIAIRVCIILEHIHEAGTIHEGLSPHCILINPDSQEVKLTRLRGSADCVGAVSSLVDELPRDGRRLAYIAPEQTGRMNRSVDHRADLYALGVVLYEMFTGGLPFDADDALKLVHCHMARPVDPPDQRNRTLPGPLSAIILRLLEKNPEDRYQSSRGVRSDLEHCLREFTSHGLIPPFTLAQNDRSSRFQISEKLYGREEACRRLMRAFDRVNAGGRELVLIPGEAGIGKTSLIRELHKPITAGRGFFLSGKFDPLRREVPYTAFVAVLRKFVSQLLARPDEELSRWRMAMLDALGNQSGVLVEMVPELELVTGPPPPPLLEDLEPLEAQKRFDSVCRRFGSLLGRLNQPVIVFLDDLQWADNGSLHLLELAMRDPDVTHLLVLAAYRDGEIGDGHRLVPTIESIQDSGTDVTELRLGPLMHADVSRLLADSLYQNPEQVAPLAELVLRVTRGNPLHAGEFLESLHAQGLIWFEVREARWTWDLPSIQDVHDRSGLLELMTARLQRLESPALDLVNYAACFGARFDVDLLARAAQLTGEEVESRLREAMAQGLLRRETELSEKSRSKRTGQDSAGASAGEYCFAHDRIQQAAYELVPEAERPFLHKRIAETLLDHGDADFRMQHIFDIAAQFLPCLEEITENTQREEVCRVFLDAGRKAKNAAAYREAHGYLQTAIALVDDRTWDVAYPLALVVHVEAAEAAYLCGRLADMEHWTARVFERADSLLDRVKAHEVRIQACFAQSNPVEAVQEGLRVLERLGVRFPRKPTKLHVLAAFLKTRFALGFKKIEELAHLPAMEDPKQIAASRIMSSIGSAAYVTVPELYPLIVFRRIRQAMRYGNAPFSAYGYVTYGLFLCGYAGDISTGYRFGRLALELADRVAVKEIQAKTRYIFDFTVRHWKEHVLQSLPSLDKAYRRGIENGDLEYAALSTSTYATHAYLAGKELRGLAADMALRCHAVDKLKQRTSLNYANICRQAALNLLGQSADPCKLVGEACDEDAFLRDFLVSNDRVGIWLLHFHRLILCYHFHRYEQAVAEADAGRADLGAIAALFGYPVYHFYDTLARLALSRRLSGPASLTMLRMAGRSRAKMKRWARHAPMNYLHKLHLIDAERFRLMERHSEAADHYQKAAELANRHGFTNEEALSYELAAYHCQERDQLRLAEMFLARCRACYQQWGALAKERFLQEAHAPYHDGEVMSWDGSLDVPAEPVDRVREEKALEKLLDLDSLAKALQALSGEMVLRRLLKRTVSIAVESGGAERGFVLAESDGKLVVLAQGELDESQVAILPGTPVTEHADFCSAAVNYVWRSGESLVVGDALSDDRIRNDPYVVARGPRSILCAPLISQGRLKGLLYLENRLTAGAFSQGRERFLRLLCAQIAAALENARLYEAVQGYSHTLENKVHERTRELASINEQLISEIHRREKTEHALRESEQRLDLALKGADLGLWDVDLKRSTSYVDGQFRRLMAYDSSGSEALSFEDWPERIHPDDRQRVMETLERHLNGQDEHFEAEFGVNVRDGNPRWLLGRGRIVERDGDAKPLRIVGTLLDVSRQKRAERALRSSETKYRRLVETANEGIFVAQGLQVMYVNDRGAELLGYTPQELVSRRLTDFVHEADRSALMSHRGESEFGAEGYAERATVRMLSRTGDMRWVEASTAPVEWEDGSATLIFLADVTKTKRSEQALIRNITFLETLMDTIPNPIYYKNADGIYLGCNTAFADTIGRSKDAVVGRTVFDLAEPDIAHMQHEKDRELLAHGGSQQYEARIALHDGHRDVIVCKSVFHDAEDSVAGLIGVVLDITDRKEAEREIRASLEEKEVLLREVHHRVKNNLQVMSSLLRLQARCAQETGVQEMLRASEGRIRAMALVHDLLYDSKTLQRIALDMYVRAVVNAAFAIFGASRPGISLNLSLEQISCGLDTAIPLGLVTNELVVNSLKHAFPSDRPGVVTIRLERLEGRTARLTVRDDGIGFDGERVPKAQGTLGLNLVDTLVSQMNGEVEQSSGQGTEFSIRFAVLEPARAPEET